MLCLKQTVIYFFSKIFFINYNDQYFLKKCNIDIFISKKWEICNFYFKNPKKYKK